MSRQVEHSSERGSVVGAHTSVIVVVVRDGDTIGAGRPNPDHCRLNRLSIESSCRQMEKNKDTGHPGWTHTAPRYGHWIRCFSVIRTVRLSLKTLVPFWSTYADVKYRI